MLILLSFINLNSHRRLAATILNDRALYKLTNQQFFNTQGVQKMNQNSVWGIRGQSFWLYTRTTVPRGIRYHYEHRERLEIWPR